MGGFWEGLGHQVGPKINKKSIWKDDEIFGGILEASREHLEANQKSSMGSRQDLDTKSTGWKRWAGGQRGV